jgi:dihydrofolate synthase/folylpolyglutamate synthase
VVAERDFSWRIHPGGWDYAGLALSLGSLPPSALAGAIQYRNAATAIAALEALRAFSAGRPGVARLSRRVDALDERVVAAALGRVHLPGRFQVIPGAVEWILDIAHNEPAARVLAAQLGERPLPSAGARGAGRTFAVVGVLADKDVAGIGGALAPLIAHWILCTLPGPRGLSAAQLAQRLALEGAAVELTASVVEGCELARSEARPGDRVIVCGSVYTVGPALQWLRIY